MAKTGTTPTTDAVKKVATEADSTGRGMSYIQLLISNIGGAISKTSSAERRAEYGVIRRKLLEIQLQLSDLDAAADR